MLQNKKLIFDLFIRNIRKKITMARLWEKLKNSLNCHNFGCVQDRVVIFGSRIWFSESAYLSPVDPRCHDKEIWDKIGYNSACVRDFCEIFAPIGQFSGMGMLPIAFSSDNNNTGLQQITSNEESFRLC